MTFLNDYDVKTALGFDEKDNIKIDLLIENKVLNKKSKDHIDEEDELNYQEDDDVKSLEQWEIKEILSTINPHYHIRDKAMIQFMARTGVRVSELVELNKTHISAKLDEKGLFVIPEYFDVIEVCLDSYMVKGKTKSRITYIDKATLQLLNKMIYARITKTRKQPEGSYKTVIQRKRPR